MATRNGPVRKYTFERSFDDPSKLYLPGERRKSEIAIERACEQSYIALPVDEYKICIARPHEPQRTIPCSRAVPSRGGRAPCWV